MFNFLKKPQLPPPPVLAGERFTFMGTKMICLGMCYVLGIPRIKACYVDSAGVIHHEDFPPNEWYALAREICRTDGPLNPAILGSKA